MTRLSEHVDTQLERTSLAWDRTGFAAAGAGLVLARVAAFHDAWVIVVVCVLPTLVAIGSLLEAGHRDPRQVRWLAGDERGRGLSLLGHATAAAVLGLAVAGLALVVFT